MHPTSVGHAEGQIETALATQPRPNIEAAQTSRAEVVQINQKSQAFHPNDSTQQLSIPEQPPAPVIAHDLTPAREPSPCVPCEALPCVETLPCVPDSTCEKQIADLLTRVETMEADLRSSRKSIADLRLDLQEANHEINRLTTSVQRWQGRFHEVQTAMKQQQQEDIAALNRVTRLLAELVESDAETKGQNP